MTRIRLTRLGHFAALALAPGAMAGMHPMAMPHGAPPMHPSGMPRGAGTIHPGHEAQNAARREMRAGNVRSLRDIERHVLPTMPGMQYLGPEYDSQAMAYRLKFIREGRVVYVDVDARSGQVLGRTQ